MALRRTIADRLFSSCSSSLFRRLFPLEDIGLVRMRFQAPAPQLIDRIRGVIPMRIRLDGLVPPKVVTAPAPEEQEVVSFSVAEVRKAVAAAQMVAVRARLRGVERGVVGYKEYLRICEEAVGKEKGEKAAKALDESGDVVVLGDVVFLRPEMVARAIESIIPLSQTPRNDHQSQELKNMEDKKSLIDRKAETLVKRELWLGLGFFVAQTFGFMRLTFWELSWDVMEPVCFFVTSVYFMAGYAFFLRTSKDPSFEGFFASRFATKQKRLMRAQNFDVGRYNELRGNVVGLPSLHKAATGHSGHVGSCGQCVGSSLTGGG